MVGTSQGEKGWMEGAGGSVSKSTFLEVEATKREDDTQVDSLGV